ncbi:MAG: acyl esterase [Mucilaginibacter sp.]|jgi:hypothetical protein|nr:acyl esterase [Mucilaginibacter sp.]
MLDVNARSIKTEEEFKYLFSICTLVSRSDEYNEMLDSFVKAGFTEDFCQYLYIDNTETNTFEAYKGINRFLREAEGKYLIICHQDILLNYDRAEDLIKRITEIEEADSNWAVLGNAGGVNLKYLSLYIVQSAGPMLYETNFPLKTMTLDENFLIVKKSANLSLSNNLAGFHLYGTDICLIADILGYNSYIIEFKLLHKSLGNVDKTFFDLKLQLVQKYTQSLRPRFLRTPFARFYISGSRLKTFINNSGIILFFARKYYQCFRRAKDCQLKINKKS